MTSATETPDAFLDFHLDNTMINTFRSCRRKFFHSYVLGLASSGRNIHLIAGGAFAAGIDAARKAAFNGVEHVDDQLTIALRAFTAEWQANFRAEDGTLLTPDLFEGEGKSFVNTFSSLEEYLYAFPPLRDEIQPLTNAVGAPTVEFSFAIPLDEAERHPSGTPFTFVGRFDMLGKWRDLPVIVDEKTTTALGQYWLQQWTLRAQFMGYCWACQQLGYPVQHAFVRGIGILKTKTTFLTAPVQFPQFLLDRWYSELLTTISEIRAAWDSYEASGFTDASAFNYNFGDTCASYGGCAFIPICQSAQPSRWYPSYSIRRWNPLHKGAE